MVQFKITVDVFLGSPVGWLGIKAEAFFKLSRNSQKDTGPDVELPLAQLSNDLEGLMNKSRKGVMSFLFSTFANGTKFHIKNICGSLFAKQDSNQEKKDVSSSSRGMMDIFGGLLNVMAPNMAHTVVDIVPTFEDGHVDVGADLRHMAEHSCGRLGSAALCWLQVITAAPAGDRRSTGRRHQGHQGGEGQKEEDTQHSCACRKNRRNYHMIERNSKFWTVELSAGGSGSWQLGYLFYLTHSDFRCLTESKPSRLLRLTSSQ